MHPSYSIIFFTVASGTGYGILYALGLVTAMDVSAAMPARNGPAFAAALLFSLALVSAGLVSSGFHLGQPKRALLAFTQWRTSWLSREAWFAALTYVPAVLLGIGWWNGNLDAWRWWGFLLTVGSIATVYSTAMIYRSLAAIPAWSNRWVPFNYLALAAANGAVWLAFISALFGNPAAEFACAPNDASCGDRGASATPTLALTAIGLLALAAAGKWQYWRAVRGLPVGSTIGSATGLDRLAPDARVHALDPPHTQPNWLQREMGYQVARRHAERLRTLVRAFAFILPSVLCFAGWLGEASGGIAVSAALGFAAVCATAGTLIERWLFFAEAEHKMALYYGRRRA